MSVYAKAIVGAVVAGLTSLYTALQDGGVSAMEWVGVALATLGTGGFVSQVPNKPKG